MTQEPLWNMNAGGPNICGVSITASLRVAPFFAQDHLLILYYNVVANKEQRPLRSLALHPNVPGVLWVPGIGLRRQFE